MFATLEDVTHFCKVLNTGDYWTVSVFDNGKISLVRNGVGYAYFETLEQASYFLQGMMGGIACEREEQT